MLKKGQVLYWVPSVSYAPGCGMVTVGKVGRKWLTLEEGTHYRYRINVEDLVADGAGFFSPGRCYLSKEEYEATEALNECESIPPARP